MPKLTQDQLKEQLSYDPLTGNFIRLVANCNFVKIGDIAGYLDPKGYIRIGVNNISYSAHRLAWLYMKGYMPKNIEIDHKDRIPYHNWFSNLRLASRQCQLRNRRVFENNTSGIMGVCWHKGNKKWTASIAINGVRKYLGEYNKFHNAVCARLAAEQCLNWSRCDSSSSAYQYVQNML